MFTVFQCRKCGHLLYVDEKKCPHKLEEIAGKICPECGEQEEGLWGLRGRAKKFLDRPMCKWEEEDGD